MSYKQQDAHFSDENNFSLCWLSLTPDARDIIRQAVIPFEKSDGSQFRAVIVREKHPIGYKMRAERAVDAMDLASQGKDGLEFMFVAGKEVSWEKINQEAKTLPNNRLDISTRTSIGNSFIVATTSDLIGMLLYHDSKWRILVSVDDAGVPIFASPVKVLCTKSN